jgi:uncharacterized protein DUF6916
VVDLEALTADDFGPHLHERFVVSPLELELGALELFLVPIGREPDGLRYEAVFT